MQMDWPDNIGQDNLDMTLPSTHPASFGEMDNKYNCITFPQDANQLTDPCTPLSDLVYTVWTKLLAYFSSICKPQSRLTTPIMHPSIFLDVYCCRHWNGVHASN